jgi:class 3 adenylate cyclase/alpha-beta hydrolase superfamily lysophospholipase
VDVAPEVHYAKSAGLSIAYQVFGEGPVDVVFVPGFISHLELNWEAAFFGETLRRLARFSRVVTFDKRGTGLSDRELGGGRLEERMDDIRVVMDAAGLERAAVFSISEGGPLALLFAASHPERVTKLALYGSFARIAAAPDYPEGVPVDLLEGFVDLIGSRWGSGSVLDNLAQHRPQTPETMAFMRRFERYSATPADALEAMQNNVEIDVRSVVPTISAPSLVVHAEDDPAIPARCGRWLARNLPDARLVELPLDCHTSWDPSVSDQILDPIEEFFLDGDRLSDLDDERVLLTVLFTDIVQSTETAGRLGDRAWRNLLDRHDAEAEREIERYRGRQVKTTGDGLLATFDGPARAVRCAQAIIGRAATLGLDVRAGVHTGECELRGADVAGIAVHIGARVAAEAGAGQVLVSQTVRDLVVGSGMEFDDLGERSLKGVEEPVRVHAAS